MKSLSFLVSLVMVNVFSAQYCDSITPSFNADLSSSSDAFWISPESVRDGNCCNTSNPDKCIEFEILLHPESEGIIFDIYSGAIPPGALYYQIDCGPVIQVGDPICLDGAGPHHLTFCKPGNNQNEYSIQSIPPPYYSPDIVINDGCYGLLGVGGVDENTVNWTSVFPGNPGDYNAYLSCTTACDTVQVTAQANYPPFVDYVVCGLPLNECDTLPFCHTIRVTFNSTLEVNIFPENPVICYGSSDIELTAVASGGTPPYSLTWNTLETDTTILASAGFYTVTLSDNSGCPPTTDTITVSQYSIPITVNAGSDLNVCVGTFPVQLNGQVSGASGGVWTGVGGSFSNGNTDLNSLYSPTIAEVSYGSSQMFLTTTGNHGCPAVTDTINIMYRDITNNVSVNSSSPTCNGYSNGAAEVIASGNDAPYSILWSTGDIGNQISGLAAGNYFVTVTNTYGCDTVVNFLIEEPLPINIQNNTQNVSCFDEYNGMVTITASGGTAPYTLFWNNLNIPFPFIGNSILVHNLAAGTYTFLIRDANSCEEASGTIISQPAELSAVLTGEDSICVGESQNLQMQVSGGTLPYHYYWSNGTINSPTNSFIPASSGYTGVTVEDANGCSVADSLYLFVQQLYQDSLSIYTSGDICIGEEVVLNSVYSGQTSNLTYQWLPCLCTGPGPYIMHPTNDTEYVLTVTDNCNNHLMDSATVLVHPLPVINLPPEIAAGCAPLDVEFFTDSNLVNSTLIWGYGDNSEASQNMQHLYQEPGTYFVTLHAINQFGCEASSNGMHSVIVHETPEAGIWINKNKVDMYYPYVYFKSTASGADSYSWDFGDGQTSNNSVENHMYEEFGYYTVVHSVSNNYGCVDTAIVEISVKPTVSVFVPNAFTPDGDGVNDDFFVKGHGLINEDFEMNIFDRWGELIFTSNQLDGKWTGEVKGMPEKAKTEVYVYTISVKDIFNETHELTGHVTLLK